MRERDQSGAQWRHTSSGSSSRESQEPRGGNHEISNPGKARRASFEIRRAKRSGAYAIRLLRPRQVLRWGVPALRRLRGSVRAEHRSVLTTRTKRGVTYEFPYAICPCHARSCPRLSNPVDRAKLRLVAVCRENRELRGGVHPKSAEPWLHFLPGSALGHLQKLFLAARSSLACKGRWATLVSEIV